MKKTLSVVMATVIMTNVCSNLNGSSDAHARILTSEDKKELFQKQDAQKAIEESIKDFNTIMHTTGNQDEANQVLAKKLVAAQVSADDIKLFIGAKLGFASNDYQNFEQVIYEAKERAKNNGLNEISAHELGALAGDVIGKVSSEGLNWSGCAGLGVGVVIALASITVGIIALVYTEGTEKINQRFDRKIRDRNSQHLRDQEAMRNQADILRNERVGLEAEKDELFIINDGLENDRAYWEGQLDAALNAEDITAAQAARDQIASINAQISANLDRVERIDFDIVQIGHKIEDWEDPNFVAARLADLEIEYQNDISNTEARRAEKLERAPIRNQRAGTLGIAAGVGAAVGTYFIIDGASDC